MASSLSQRQQLSEAFSSWRLQRQRSQAARRLERLLTKHLQRRRGLVGEKRRNLVAYPIVTSWLNMVDTDMQWDFQANPSHLEEL
jgi:hypothetical protein